MGDLSELNLRTSYHKGRDDIARDFYLPCMERANRFDRAVGYFRSTAFTIAWPALKGFLGRSGRMQFLCSQVLADEDVRALEEGYEARVDTQIALRLYNEVRSLLNEAALSKPATILSGLVADGILDLKIAILRERDLRSARGRLFHDKLGIFRDESGNRVIFKGSMNETWNGLSADGNLESVDVAASWLGMRDLERADAEDGYFQDLWNDRYPGVSVRRFPEVARDEFVRMASKSPGWERLLDELAEGESQPAPDVRGRVLHSHQSAGLASWAANGRHGILAFATGAGKTFTAITAIREAIVRFGDVALVVVPDRTLFAQWDAELTETLADLSPKTLRAGAGNRDWRQHLTVWTRAGDQPRVILATVKTASNPEFRSRIAGGDHLMLVADEVHRLGSPKYRSLLQNSKFGARLGLSATPERYGDTEGTSVILDFFGGVLEPPYTLADAIHDHVLTPYFYRPHPIVLDDEEAAQWTRFTADIAQLSARLHSSDPSPGLAEKLQRRLIARARIIKHARAKVQLAIEVLGSDYQQGQRWIIYCDDGDQLEEVRQAVAVAGFQAIPYHSTMAGDRAETLRWIAKRGGILVAIKCLDEGVDIPSVSHALILASSKNPREFVQRRGRVLRKAPGKALAFIHDAIVLPPQLEAGDPDAPMRDPFTFGEIARAIEFATHADNPASSADLQEIALRAGLDWRRLSGLGEEDADD